MKKHYYEDLGNGDFGPGWKVAFDHFAVYQRVRDMTEDNQNRDIHWVNHVKISNRVSGNDLPDDKPIMRCLSDLDNSKVVPSTIEHVCQRANYVNLVSRVLVEEIPCLKFCKDSIISHISHKHSLETSTKSQTLSPDDCINRETQGCDFISSKENYIYLYIYGSVLVNEMPKSARYHIDRENSIVFTSKRLHHYLFHPLKRLPLQPVSSDDSSWMKQVVVATFPR